MSEPGTPTAQADHPSGLRRHLLDGTLTLGMLVGMVTIGVLGSLGPFITRDLDMSRARFGSLATVMFVMASLVSPAIGGLVDRVDAKRMLAGLFVVIATGQALMSLAVNYPLLLACTGLAGFGLATANPTTNQLIVERVPEGRRGHSVGMAYTGPQLALLLTGLALPVVAEDVGWRGAVLATAGVSASGVLAVWLWIPARRRARPAGPVTTGGGASALSADHRWLVVFAFLMGFATTALPAHLPLFATEELGMSPQVAGWALVVVGALAIPGRLMWIRFATRRSDSVRSMLGVSVGSVVGQVVLVGSIVVGVPLVWVASAILGLTGMAWMPLAMLAVMALADPRRAGRAAGIVQRATFTGAASGPLVVGFLADRAGSYLLPWGALVAVYLYAIGLLVRARNRTPAEALAVATAESS